MDPITIEQYLREIERYADILAQTDSDGEAQREATKVLEVAFQDLRALAASFTFTTI